MIFWAIWPPLIFFLHFFYKIHFYTLFIYSPTPLPPPLLPWLPPKLRTPPLPPVPLPTSLFPSSLVIRHPEYTIKCVLCGVPQEPQLQLHGSVGRPHLPHDPGLLLQSRPMSAPPSPLTSLGCLTCTRLLGPSSGPSSSLVHFLGAGLRLPTWHFA